VKAPVKSNNLAMGASSSSTISKQSKRIDLGAASNYGKTTELGINSPTHRNTHSEDLFGSEISSSSSRNVSGAVNDILDADDFDPRAGEAVASGDFGDFESAFGVATATSSKAPQPSSSSMQNAGTSTNFADFSSAFSSSKLVTSQPLDDNFLFASQPNSAATNTTSNDLSADLFGNNVITSAFTSQHSTSSLSAGKNDLLDDFADLKINTGNQGE
jgi:clathrin interactor 1